MSALPVMAYSPGEVNGLPRVMRGLLAAGVIHGGACALYVVQRVARWLDGTELELQAYQSTLAAGVGLCLQFVLGFGLAASCLVALRWPSRAWLRVVAFFAVVLGPVWFAYGVADAIPHYFPTTIIFASGIRAQEQLQYFELTLRTLCRESNQAMLCALLVFGCLRERSERTLVRLVWLAVVVSCVLVPLPTLYVLCTPPYFGLDGNAAYYCKAIGGGLAYLLAGLLMLLMRKRWRFVAALPLIVHVLKTFLVDEVLTFEELAVAPTFASIMANLRHASFLLVAADMFVASFAVFTVLNVPRPMRRRLA